MFKMKFEKYYLNDIKMEWIIDLAIGPPWDLSAKSCLMIEVQQRMEYYGHPESWLVNSL